jgi:hypothetical protein
MALALAFILALALAPRSMAASDPYEPNDSIGTATGPLVAGASYSAALESPSDRDFFFFYMTGTATASASIAIANNGGGSQLPELNVTVYDTSEAPVGASFYVREGEARNLTVSLAPGKYLLAVVPNDGFGDSYTLSPSGGTGAFGEYAQISARCRATKHAAAAAARQLEGARARLRRAEERLRRSHYGTQVAQDRARAFLDKTKRRVSARKNQLRTAKDSLDPWCSIPQ